MSESLSLGSLFINIEANTSSLNRVIPSLDKLEKTVNKLAASIDKMTSALGKGSNRSTRTVVNNNKKLDRSLKNTSTRLKVTSTQAHKMQSRLQGMSTSATLALGPLSGVASRLTAISSLFNRNNLAIASVFASLTAFTVGTYKAIKAGAAHQKTLAQWEGQLRVTGNAVGFTTDQLDDMSKAIAINTLQSVEGSREATTALLSYTTITGKNFKRTLKLAADMSAVLGDNLTAATKKLAKSLADPGEALDSLSKAGIRFTDTEIRMLKVMDATGKSAQAQSFILSKLESRFKGAGEAAATNTLAGAWDTLGERATLFFEKLLNGQGALKGITHLINTAANVLVKLTKSIDDGSYSTSIYAEAIDGLAHGLAFLLENIVPVTAALIALSVSAPLAGLLLALPIGFAGVLKLQKGLWMLKRATFAAGAAFAGWQIGKYLRENFKEVRTFTFFVVGMMDMLVVKLTAFGKIIGTILTRPFTWAMDNIRETFAQGLEKLAGVLPSGDIAEFLGIDDSLSKTLTGFAESLRNTKNGAADFGDQLKKIVVEHNKGIAAADKNILAYLMYENQLESTAKASAKAASESAKWVKQRDAEYKDIIKRIDVLSKIASKYNSSTKAANDFSDALKIIAANTITVGGVTQKANVSLEQFLMATKSGANASKKEIEALTAAYVAFMNDTENLTKTTVLGSPFGTILKQAEIDLKALDQLTTRDYVFDFFGGKSIDNVMKFNSEVNALTKTYETLGDSGTAGFAAVRKQMEDTAKAHGLEGLIPKGEIISAEQLATAVIKIKDSAKPTKDAWKEAGSFILGQYTDVINQMQALYEQQASAYGQIALDALESGRSTAQFYMELANTVRYSNNEQAKSFEDKAMAAAKSAAAEYAANKKLQDQANASAKKNFENQKLLQKGQIIMNTANAIMATYSTSGGFLLGGAPAAAMAALGATQLSLVSKQSYTPRAEGGTAVGGDLHLIGEKGPEFFVPGKTGTVISNKDIGEALNGNGGGGTTVNFYIETPNAAGFEEMLVRSRGTITNIIRGAQNEQMGASF